MHIIGCNCGNIIVNIASEQDKSPLKLDIFNNNNLRFFKEALGPYKSGQIKITREQIALLQSIKFDNWTIFRCINCDSMVYGQANGSENIIFNSLLRKTHDDITKLRKSEDFSPIFKIVIRKMPNIESTVNSGGPALVSRIGMLKDQLEHYYQIETNAAEEEIRLFTQRCYSKLNDKRKCSEEHYNQLINLIKRVPEDIKIKEGIDDPNLMHSLNAATTNLETPPATPDANLLPMSVGNSPPILNANNSTTKENGNNNGIMIKKSNQQSINESGKKNYNMAANSPGNLQRPMSYDDECLFDLDGVANDPIGRNKENQMFYIESNDNDDDVDSDTEIMPENSEGGIHIVPHHARQQQNNSSARSLPINMPTLLNRFRTTEEDFEEIPEDNVDIAASIKAMAKSVHGIFGDLPRPRFSTQL